MKIVLQSNQQLWREAILKFILRIQHTTNNNNNNIKIISNFRELIYRNILYQLTLFSFYILIYSKNEV